MKMRMCIIVGIVILLIIIIVPSGEFAFFRITMQYDRKLTLALLVYAAKHN